MANIGMILPPGYVAVYGRGREVSSGDPTPSGLFLEPDMRMGTVYNIWDGGAPYIYGGDVVWWDERINPTRIVTAQSNLTYTIIPARLVTQDNTVIPP